MREDEYLGDGLYASFDGYHIELYAHNGARKTSSVFLDGEVLNAFLRYVEHVKEEARMTREPCPHCGKPIHPNEDHHCDDAVGDRKAA